MTTSAPHATTMSMPHTCAGHPNRHLNRTLQSVCIVVVQITAQHNVAIGVLHWRPQGTRNFNVPTAKFWETRALTDQIIIILKFLGESRITTVIREGTHLEVLVNTQLDSSNKIIMLIILDQISGIMGISQEDQYSPMLDLMRDKISTTLHPYTHPHLH